VITTVDTNILIDIFTADPTFGQASAQAVRNYLEKGILVACAVVWTEMGCSGFFDCCACPDPL